jgi:hypothetical protein
MHLIAGHFGVFFLPQAASKKAMIITTVGSFNFGVMLAASYYLNKQKHEQDRHNKNGFEITKFCMSTMFAYTFPSLATCALTQLGMPGVQCSFHELGIKISIAGWS